MVSLLFGFNGRIGRAQYWLGSIGAGVGGMFVVFALGMMFAPPPDLPKGAASPNAAFVALAMGLVMLAMSWCGFALQVKRFHDRGKSGYWALAPIAPVVMITMEVLGGVASNAPAEAVVPAVLPWLGVLMLINLWLFVDLGLLPGTSGPNKYDYTPGSGGGPGGGGVPVFSPSPAAPLAAASIFGGAEQAMDRAIAEQARAAMRTEMAAVRATTPSAGFGRKPSR